MTPCLRPSGFDRRNNTVPGELTEITEVATALGMLCPDLATAVARAPAELRNVPGAVWERIVDAHTQSKYAASFASAFENGRAFRRAVDGLRGRRPRLVEWKGPHRPPGDDVIPADLRIDHVYLVSCKYLSRVLLNPWPDAPVRTAARRRRALARELVRPHRARRVPGVLRRGGHHRRPARPSGRRQAADPAAATAAQGGPRRPQPAR